MAAEAGRMIGAPGPDGVPPGRAVLWRQFLLWALGTPALVAAGLGIVWAAHWAAGSAGLMPKADMEAFYILLGLAAIALAFPVMLYFWVAELREGLAARRAWEALPPGERAEAARGALAAVPPKPKGGRRRARG